MKHHNQKLLEIQIAALKNLLIETASKKEETTKHLLEDDIKFLLDASESLLRQHPYSGEYNIKVTATHKPKNTTLGSFDLEEDIVLASCESTLDNDISEEFSVEEVILVKTEFKDNKLILDYLIVVDATPFTKLERKTYSEKGADFKWDDLMISILESESFYWHCPNWEVETFEVSNPLPKTK